MSSLSLDRLVSRWLVVTAGILGTISLLVGATGVYFDLLGASNWRVPLLLGFWGLELALLLGAVASVQALWRSLRRRADLAQPGVSALLAATSLGGFLSAMIATVAAFLWFMSSPTSIVLGKAAAIGLGVTLLPAVGVFLKRTPS